MLSFWVEGRWGGWGCGSISNIVVESMLKGKKSGVRGIIRKNRVKLVSLKSPCARGGDIFRSKYGYGGLGYTAIAWESCLLS